ncbi:MAG: lasso peptide biosynthesis B2 protein [Gemmatimonadetes bacterium]|nr:lasso peptide biosynthesis B2 protein [Gemmatimonadota bacterium]
MRRLNKLRRLSSSERNLLVRSFSTVLAARILLWVLPFRVLHRATVYLAGRRGAQPSVSIQQISWAVDVSSRRVPRATCLTQAIAAQILLGREGYEPRLYLGVARGNGGDFKAHAWVQCSGTVVVGGAERVNYTPLLGIRTVSHRRRLPLIP